MSKKDYNKDSRTDQEQNFHTSHKKFKPREKGQKPTTAELLNSIEEEELEEPLIP